MPDHIHLLLHNIAFILAALLGLSMSALIYFKDRKPLVNKLMIGGYLACTLFNISHLLAVNVTSGVLSRTILQINGASIFTSVLILHAMLIYMGIAQMQKRQIITMYGISIAISVFLWLFPDTFLLESVPKMYFPNYYVAGSLYGISLLWNVLLLGYFVYQMYKKYKQLGTQEKNRTKYFVIASISAFYFGSMSYWLAFDLPIDPIWSALTIPLFTIPITYAILKYDLLDIRIITKRTLIYVVVVACAGIFIILFNFLNNLLITRVPGFPLWLLPFLSALIVVSIGVYVWKKFRQDEILKYEFITVVTHKFRTPLTHIKWASENLAQADTSPEDRVQLSYVQNANTKLVELTNLLMNVSETENSAYDYQIRRNNVSDDVADIVVALKASAEAKNISLINTVPTELFGTYDSSRIKFVIQILIENAIHYTPERGTITLSSSEDDNSVTLRISDTGIGIPPEELDHLFSKFYRGKRAQVTDTEGMGIGLFLSKAILERQRGKIWAESEGTGKGSTLALSLPKSK